MKIIIIGNNVAGTFSAQNIRNLNKDVNIEIYTNEEYPYYTRINLPQLISGKVDIQDLIVFGEDWYKKNNIDLKLNVKVNAINLSDKSLTIGRNNERISYDKLILTLGSTPNIPPIKNASEMRETHSGVFTLRNVKDALAIKKYIKDNNVKKVVVIGGGLLGLELANQIKDLDLKTTIVEFFPQLLPKQLDEECALMLKEEIEKRKIDVVLNATTDEILGNGRVTKIRLRDGHQIPADLVLIQAGINPTIDIAKQAGIKTNKGIIVNQYLETSEKEIYAAGDCIEYNNQIWGIIPACMEQSKIIAASVLGLKKVEYHGTTPKNTLKIMGLDLTSIGTIDPSREQGGGWDILKKADKKDCCYQKIVLKDNMMKGAILFGDNKAISYVYSKMEKEVSKTELKKILRINSYKCSQCGNIFDESEQGIAFEDLPEDWRCPNCGNPKINFQLRGE
jgi:nitrite reductase (NADH) large subunit